MRKAINMEGQTFSSLTVIKRAKRTDAKGRVHWICQCHCGRYLVVRGDQLRRGGSTQCSICHFEGDGRSGRPSRFVEEGDVINGIV